jgi:hypothetical protein
MMARDFGVGKKWAVDLTIFVILGSSQRMTTERVGFGAGNFPLT